MNQLRLALLGAALALTACHGRPRSSVESSRSTNERGSRHSDGPAIVELDLTEGAPEQAHGGLLESRPRDGYYELVSVLHTLADDGDARAAFVRFGSSQIGWSRAQEIGALLQRAREAKKSVVCHADGYTNTTYFIAARACDRIWVSPAGDVSLVGVAAQLVFAHRLLAEKLGVDVDFLQVGKYKGAEELFTRDGPSPEARASLEGVLAALRSEWLDALSQRGATARSVAEDGPFSPETARRKGLVDAVGDVDDARRDAEKVAGTETFQIRFGSPAHGSGSGGLGDLLHAVASGGGDWGGTPHIAVVRAVGAIAMDGRGSVMGQRAGITERALGRIVRKLADDGSARAVVLRIDSPGGSALASDLLWKQLMQLRGKKPVVISIGDMAASGGYYLASAGTRILAEPTSIVGSIGVVGGKLAFGRALEQIGVHVETVAAASGEEAQARAAYESPLVAWDPATRARIHEGMTAVYELFVRRVSDGRKLPIEQVMEVAEGRIFAGAAAQEGHLVDEWGGLDRAIAIARQLGELDDKAPVRLVGRGAGVWDWLDSDDDDSGLESRTALPSWFSALLPFRVPQRGAWLGALATPLSAHVASISPLWDGEHAIAAIPFVLLLH